MIVENRVRFQRSVGEEQEGGVAWKQWLRTTAVLLDKLSADSVDFKVWDAPKKESFIMTA